MTTLEAENKNSISLSRQVAIVLADRAGKPSVVLADSKGAVPTEFELLKVGMWRTPYHGDIMIMPEDITAYIDNFKAGYGVSGNNKLRLPINYAHESWEKAAGWFTPAVSDDGLTLLATQVKWTPAATQALIDGEWKCISAEFCPAGRGGWIDPLDDEHYVENVLTGAALTNIPLFSNLEPVMASAGFGKDGDKPEVFLITASEEIKEKNMPTLEEVLKIDNESLTEEQRQVLVENKETLTDEQKTQYGFEVTPIENKNEEESEVPQAANQELAEVAADIKSGKKMLIEASAWKDTQDQLTELRRKDVMADVTKHVARGAIKADTVDKWTDRILKDPSLKEDLENLPANPVMADTQGTDVNAGDATQLESELMEKVAAAKRDPADTAHYGKPFAEVRASIIKSDDRFKSLTNEQA